MPYNERLTANRAIVQCIAEEVEKHPKWRFHQLLQNLGVSYSYADQWYEESVDTLDRISKTHL